VDGVDSEVAPRRRKESGPSPLLEDPEDRSFSRPKNGAADAVTDPNRDQKVECQIECQNRCQIEYQNECQNECQNICQIEWQEKEQKQSVLP
jgi:hypothetical protein